jgi:CRP-like cAMP-binding protein
VVATLRARRSASRPSRSTELSDPVLFPRLSDAEIEQLAEREQPRTYETDEQLFEHGMRDAPFFIIEHGTVDIVEHRLEEDVWFARMDGGTFIGDVSMFTGEPTLAAGVAVEPTSVIVFERPELLAELPEFGELVLQTMTARRAGTSTRIENFLGFPSGISGTDLTRKAGGGDAARTAEFISPTSAAI